MDIEKKFREELEDVLIREKSIEVLIIGKPYIETKWLVSLQIAAMIINYYKLRLIKEVEPLFCLDFKDIPFIKMKSHDINIISIQHFREGHPNYIPKRANQENYILVSDEGLSENKNLEASKIFTIEAISQKEDKLICNVSMGEIKEEIAFSKPPNNLIEKYRKARRDAEIRNMKKQTGFIG
nr:hypothetical protein [Candidatus Anoxychlamydiales bacterium]